MNKFQIFTLTSLLLFVGIITQNPRSAQANQLATATPLVAPTPTSTPLANQVSPPVTNEVTYKDLVEHYSRVTDLVLKIIGTVVTLLGVFGVVAGYLSLKTIRDLQKLVDDMTNKVKEVEDSLSDINAVREFSLKATNRVRYILELRSKNADLRTRAAQQLGESNDILAVEILAELLENDENENVKIESAYGIGRLLSIESPEIETVNLGISGLGSTPLKGGVK